MNVFEARTRSSYSLKNSVAISTIVIPFFFIVRKEAFDFSKAPSNIFITLLFFIFLYVVIYWWIKFLDKRPVISMNEISIELRSGIWPMSRFHSIPWKEMYYFYQIDRTGHRIETTSYLIIRRKESADDIKIEISGLDKTVVSILSAIRKKSVEFNFIDFGKEYM